MKIAYKDWNPKPESLDLIETANGIITEYEDAGYVLTLRQLYYQFIRRNLLPNTERSYKNLGTLVTNAREAGLMSWRAIEDRTREHKGWYTNEDEEQIVQSLEGEIVYDLWKDQDYYVEVWVEKEALSEVIRRPCSRLQVSYMACKGFLSASAAWRAGQRFRQARDIGKECVLIHLGDHDPSGMDMTRDNADRLELFGEYADVDVRRIALNMDQIEAYNPPENPAKLTDSRAAEYIARYGRSSWELDALEPRVIDELITDTITEYIDEGVKTDALIAQQDAREIFQKLARNWDDVRDYVGGLE